VRGTLVLSVAMAIFAMACYTGPSAEHFEAVLNRLEIPDAWELVKSEVRSPDGDVQCQPGIGVASCPAVTRFYVVARSAVDALAQSKTVAADAGLETEDEFFQACDGPPSGPACSLQTVAEDARVRFTIYEPGRDLGLGLDVSDATTVLVKAER
jgi:hypothetical protein